jgi:hypothetical protein
VVVVPTLDLDMVVVAAELDLLPLMIVEIVMLVLVLVVLVDGVFNFLQHSEIHKWHLILLQRQLLLMFSNVVD